MLQVFDLVMEEVGVAQVVVQANRWDLFDVEGNPSRLQWSWCLGASLVQGCQSALTFCSTVPSVKFASIALDFGFMTIEQLMSTPLPRFADAGVDIVQNIVITCLSSFSL